MESGADFIKTSTGKIEPAATPEAAFVMCRCIKEYYNKTGKKVGFKPAGGIVSAKDAILYYSIVDTVLGKEWLNSKLFRLGASRLANNLLTELENKTVNYFKLIMMKRTLLVLATILLSINLFSQNYNRAIDLD